MPDAEQAEQPTRGVIKREPVKSPEQIALDERREEMARRLGLTRSHATAYYRRGLQNYQNGDLENAILDLSEAIHYDRNHAEYYSTRGLFHLEDNKEEEAELDLQHALKLNKRQWLAHYALGILDFRRGEYDSAVTHFNEAQAAASNRPEIWLYRGVAQHYAGDDAKAAADLERAEQLFPKGDKRLKDVRAWLKEVKKNAPALPKSGKSSAPPLKRAERPQPQLEAPDEPDKPDESGDEGESEPG
jgi:tetratricopeptide (TPR) repeat protein